MHAVCIGVIWVNLIDYCHILRNLYFKNFSIPDMHKFACQVVHGKAYSKFQHDSNGMDASLDSHLITKLIFISKVSFTVTQETSQINTI